MYQHSGSHQFVHLQTKFKSTAVMHLVMGGRNLLMFITTHSSVMVSAVSLYTNDARWLRQSFQLSSVKFPRSSLGQHSLLAEMLCLAVVVMLFDEAGVTGL